jgi:hypothetical protein
MSLPKLLILAIIVSGLLCSCSHVDPNAAVVYDPPPSPTEIKVDPTPTPTPEKGSLQTGKIIFKGVSFTEAIPGVTGVQPTVEPAFPLTDPNNKPDGVEPRNIKFSFLGPYADRDTFYSPAIQIYPVNEYREAWSIEPHYVELFDNDMKRLKDVIARRSKSIPGLPGLSPYCDCSPDVVARIKYVSFNSGKGILYLAHFRIEDDLVRDRALTYIFQGFTSDNKYYIFGAFPVTSKLLPDSFVADEHLGYKLPESLLGNDWKQKRDRYKRYIARVQALLASQRPGHFEPDLETIEGTISTLEVRDH